VAAVSTCSRVASELNEGDKAAYAADPTSCTPPGTVSYQVRYDSQTTSNTRLKFMTDGILLREIQFDFLLRDYSAILLDEVRRVLSLTL
jgi:ATP-dependent RNA helicase DHX37/DHR1